jgi:hypothetical protein
VAQERIMREGWPTRGYEATQERPRELQDATGPVQGAPGRVGCVLGAPGDTGCHAKDSRLRDAIFGVLGTLGTRCPGGKLFFLLMSSSSSSSS